MSEESFSVTVVMAEGDVDVALDTKPSACPVCHREATVVPVTASLAYRGGPVQVVFRCPARGCRGLFSAIYQNVGTPVSSIIFLKASSAFIPWTETVEFPEHVERVSARFATIYNQAESAHAAGLDEIAGPGYRKALEVLVKDYILSTLPEGDQRRDEVLKTFLQPCIARYIDDVRIKQMAERAAWLGNDESHYVRKWDSKDVSDLKNLIRATVGWIDLALTHEKYMTEMPEGKK